MANWNATCYCITYLDWNMHTTLGYMELQKRYDFEQRKYFKLLAGYFQSYSLDPDVVLTHSYGLQGAFGYWVQPMGDGGSGYIQPVRMAVA